MEISAGLCCGWCGRNCGSSYPISFWLPASCVSMSTRLDRHTPFLHASHCCATVFHNGFNGSSCVVALHAGGGECYEEDVCSVFEPHGALTLGLMLMLSSFFHTAIQSR